jgi:tetratricopeptide (TPR) repeat protein
VDPSAPRTPWRAVAALAALHVALGLWALAAWIQGPFGGEGVLDGAEVLALARSGSAGPFETKSPLYPALLRAAFALAGDSPRTVGALGLLLSLATLLAVVRLARVMGHPNAAPWAAGLYALSGSTLAFAVQPLPAMLATALLAWGTVWAVRASSGGSPRDALLAGLFLGAATFTRAPLLVASLALVGALVARGRPRRAAVAAGGIALVAVACFAIFGARAWPAASMLNLRLGNGGERSGIADLRPGPGYDRVRLEAAFAAPEARGEAPHFERYQRDALLGEVRADSTGALTTLARKAYLAGFRTETVTSADFRHGLRGFPLAPLLLLSFGLVAPLALASLLRLRPLMLWLPLLGVLAVNVAWLTSARYRLPALPLACVAAGMLLAAPPRPRDWLLAALLAVPLNVNLSGVALTVPGDGLVQEGRLWMQRDRLAPRALEAYEEALAAGSQDARACYELALALEARGEVEAAEDRYREALALDPLYPEAAENLVALMLRGGRTREAIDEAERLRETSPYAGKVWLNLAAARRRLDPDADVTRLEAEGLHRLSLRSLAQGDLGAARRLAAEARSRGSDDARLP